MSIFASLARMRPALAAAKLPLPTSMSMRAFSTREDILKLRNIGISAHIDSGKVSHAFGRDFVRNFGRNTD